MQVACIAQADKIAGWKVFPLGDPALMIKLPGEVTPMATPVPSDLINRLERFDTYRFYHAEGKVVAIFKFVQYNAPIRETADTLMENEVKAVMKSIDAEQVVHADKDIKIKNIPARKSTGSFLVNQQKWNYQDILVRKDSSMWQVWIAGEDSDPAFAKTVNQVVKSIKF